MNYLFIFLGGGLGSLARFLTSKAALKIMHTNFPLGTFLSNIIACVILALIVVFIADRQEEYSWLNSLLIIGFCGGYSTFSTFSHETLQLIDQGHILLSVVNVLLSIAVGIGLIFLIKAKG